MLQIDEELMKFEWKHIPETFYIIKFKFDSGYNVLVSDFSSLYEEKLNESEIQERFHILNPCVEMKTKVIMKNLQHSLENFIQTNKNLNLERSDDKLLLKLKFEVNEVIFSFDMTLNILSRDKIFNFIIAPLILTSSANHQKYLEYKRRVEDLESCLPPNSSSSKLKKEYESDSKVIESSVPIELIIKSFLEVQRNFGDLFLDKKSKQTESKDLSISIKSHTGKGALKNALSISGCKREIASYDPLLSGAYYNDNEEDLSHSVKTEDFNSSSVKKQDIGKVKKKKINL